MQLQVHLKIEKKKKPANDLIVKFFISIFYSNVRFENESELISAHEIKETFFCL